MSSPSPTQRSLKFLRDEGWCAQVVEHWNAQGRVRVDLFGFGDIFCLRRDKTLIVQTTSTSNQAARVTKILASEIAREWVSHPDRLLAVHGWRKYQRAVDGKQWRPTVTWIEPRSWAPTVAVTTEVHQEEVHG